MQCLEDELLIQRIEAKYVKWKSEVCSSQQFESEEVLGMLLLIKKKHLSLSSSKGIDN